MNSIKVEYLMVPLDEYAVVSREATLFEAILALDEAQKRLPPGRHPYRAVLVTDEDGKIIGKIGQLALLKALEPKYSMLGDLGALSRAGVSEEFVNSMRDHYRFFANGLTDLSSTAKARPVMEVMQPVTDSIDQGASLSEAINRIVMGQTLSILVTHESQVVGLLRLSEIVEEITRQIKSAQT